MDPEKRIFCHRVQFAVESFVIFLLQIGGHTGPQGIDVIDDLILVKNDLFAVFPLFFLAESDFHRKETAVFVKQRFYLAFLCVRLVFGIEMQHNVGSPVFFICRFQGIFGGPFTSPFDSLCSFLP